MIINERQLKRSAITYRGTHAHWSNGDNTASSIISLGELTGEKIKILK